MPAPISTLALEAVRRIGRQELSAPLIVDFGACAERVKRSRGNDLAKAFA